MVLLAVGSDYNLLVINRFKEELHAGMKTGLIPRTGKHRRSGHVCRARIRLHDDVDDYQ